jgi:multidrug efflux pump subunit AcrB
MISIPLSLAIGLSALYFLGFSLNQISIAGFVVALGLLVDDSIVVVENIARFLREGTRARRRRSSRRARSSKRSSAAPRRSCSPSCR